MHDWYETADQLMKNENFGYELSKENHYLKEAVNPATEGLTDPLDKAKHIFEFVRKNYL
jgi:hypothetical protein